MPAPATLILLPGLDGTEVFLQPLLAQLPEWIRPIVVTYPASGSQDYSDLVVLARQAIADIDECYVLGWSFAGPLALMLAAAEPAKVRGVILSASFVRPPRKLLSKFGFALVGPAVWMWRAARRLPLWVFKPRADLFRMAKTQTWKRVPAQTIAARLRAILAVDASGPLRDCTQPVLYIAAASDDAVPRHNLEEIVGLNPSVSVVTIDGRHFAMYSNPGPAAHAIASFMRKDSM